MSDNRTGDQATAEGSLPVPTASESTDPVSQNPMEGDDDSDSALGLDATSSTDSLTSSILRYRTLNGRTYHSERGNAQYWASNDEKQNEMLDILHHIMTLTGDGKIFFAPVKQDIQTALDIGTGTGIWAIDFADDHPNTQVIGTDISPIQPSWVPPNLTFEIEDCTAEWTFKSDSIDYVHMRWLLGSIADWTELFKQAYRVLKPGGYVESFEPGSEILCDDGTVQETDAMAQWGKLFTGFGKKIGRPFTVLQDELQKKGMLDAGFVDINERNFITPMSGWPKDPKLKQIGHYQRLTAEQDTDGTLLFAANAMGWSQEETLIYAARIRKEVQSGKHHGYYRQKVVWARKPESAP